MSARQLSWGLIMVCLWTATRIYGQGTDFTGKLAPPLSIKEYLNVKGGKPPNIKGKVLMYDFWTTWCGVCKRAIPRMNAIDQTFRKKGLVLIGITYENRPAVEKFLRTTSLTYPIALDRDQETFTAYGIVGVPTAYIVGVNGRVVWNGQPESLIDSQIEELIREGMRAGELESEGEKLPPLAFDKTGDGPPVVLIHGLGGSARDWDKILPVWSKNLTLYAVDLYGHGRTPALGRPTTVVDCARGVMQFIRRENIDCPVLVGHSLGGLVALQLAEITPSAFVALIVVDMPPAQRGLTKAEQEFLRTNADGFIREHWGRMASKEEDSQRIVKSALAADRQTFLSLLANVAETDLRPGLSSLRLPLQVVYAEPPGGFTPATNPEKLYADVPQVDFSIMSGVRHFVMLDNPHGFTVTVFKFLAKCFKKETDKRETSILRGRE